MRQPSNRELDTQLQQELYQRVQDKELHQLDSFLFRNQTIHSQVIGNSSLKDLFTLLEKKNTFKMNTETILWRDIDGESRELTINRASKIDMWPMGTNYWVRDNAFIAQKLLNFNYKAFQPSSNWFQTGKQLLLSCLTIMSSQTQLDRFNNIITGSCSAQEAINWPHIFLDIESNINAEKDESWMHKQDAWQILCFITLEALEQQHLQLSDLTDKHQQLLKLICPFLKKINFTQNNNAGSWEEIDTVRSSVIIWETALLNKINTSENFHHPEAKELLDQGLNALSQMLPSESPDYGIDNPRHRDADASLLYLFVSGVDLLLPKARQRELREKTLSKAESLLGSHGMKRYQGDSYQGLSYYTNTIASELSALYDSPSGDSSSIDQFTQRSAIVPPGHEAQWTHFIWQLSSIYGELAKRHPENEDYKKKQQHYFLHALSLITGENEHSISESKSSKMQVIPIPSFQIPECYNTEQYQQTIFSYPSHHTPLYWSIAESIEAFSSMPTQLNFSL